MNEGKDKNLTVIGDDDVTMQNAHDNDNSTNTSGAGTVNSNKSFISKRILCELLKSDVDEREKAIANDASQKFDFLIDIILNRGENKIHFINQFMCYIVEINSELIKILPEYKDSSEDINLRFIIPAKNIYNYAVEVYFSIHDLYQVINKL